MYWTDLGRSERLETFGKDRNMILVHLVNREFHSSEQLLRRVSQVDFSSSDFPTFLVLFRLCTVRTSDNLMPETDTNQLERIVQLGKILNEGNEFDNPRFGAIRRRALPVSNIPSAYFTLSSEG